MPKAPPGVTREFMKAFERAVKSAAEFAEGGRDVLEQDPKASGEALALYIQESADLFHKWTLEMLYVLNFVDHVSFTQLRRLMGGLNQKILTEKLVWLEERGFVGRVKGTQKNRKHYAITDAGQTMAQLTFPLILYASLQRGVRPRGPLKAVVERRGSRRVRVEAA